VHALRGLNPDVYILHIDTFERHAALDSESAARVSFLNQRRFLFEELISGKLIPEHPLYPYLLENGFPEEHLEWHLMQPVQIDERGGNYYPLSEEALLCGRTHQAPSESPVGFAGVVREYAHRLSYPLSLTETNIQGTVRDRISWLKYMCEQAEALEVARIALRSFSWYPLFDCAGWNCLLQHKRWRRDPQGIVSCGKNWKREPTELTKVYGNIARGTASRDVPAYLFTPQHEKTLTGFRRQMNWNWSKQ